VLSQVNLPSSPRRRRVHQRYMRLQPLSCFAQPSPEELEDSESEDGPCPMVYKIRSEPLSPTKKTSMGAKAAGPRLQLLRELQEESEEAQAKSARGPAQRRRDSFHSLGSHVDWKTLLEYAGDRPEAWSARKVHRWLGMGEKDAFEFLMELVQLRETLNKGEEPEMQAGPDSSTIATPREQAVPAKAPNSKGWVGWMFGGGGPRAATVQAQAQTQAQPESGGFFSWLFLGGSSYQRVPSTVKPMRLQHTDIVEYQLDKLDEVGLLGRGAFGQVTLVRCSVTGQLLALKAISKGMLVEMQLQQSVMIEKAVMQATCNPFLVKMAATFNRQDTLFLLLEAVMGGDLYTVYRRFSYFGSEEHARFYAACAVSGFEHLHKNRILYRDLKMENLVLDLRGYCKLCDFGTSTFDFDAAYTMCGTPEYMPPEVVCGTGHGPAADWWTLGVLIYEMVMAVTPFAEDQPLQIFAKAKAGIERVEGFNEIETAWSDLVRGLCKQEPAKRLPMLEGGIDNIRQQAWFAEAGFDWEALEAGSLPSPHVPQCAGPEDLCNFAGEEQEVPLELPYVDPGDEWDKNFEDPVGPRQVARTDP